MLTEGQEILEGRFRIVEKLGSGAFGEIYKGTHYSPLTLIVVEKKKTGEFYAAKIVSQPHNDDSCLLIHFDLTYSSLGKSH